MQQLLFKDSCRMFLVLVTFKFHSATKPTARIAITPPPPKKKLASSGGNFRMVKYWHLVGY
jgi:hypothetical protein